MDVDFALQGIDKLLRSQELTFAFVGVAPSFLIVYLLGGWFRGFLSQAGGGFAFTTGKGTKKQRRRKSWDSIRSVTCLQSHTLVTDGLAGRLVYLTLGL